jgi:hypothetical protein
MNIPPAPVPKASIPSAGSSGPKPGDLVRIIRPPSPEEKSVVGHVCVIVEIAQPKHKLILTPNAPRPMTLVRVVVLSPRGEPMGMGELPLVCIAPESSDEWKKALAVYETRQAVYTRIVGENEAMWKSKVEELSKEVSVPVETLDKAWRVMAEFYAVLEKRLEDESQKAGQ